MLIAKFIARQLSHPAGIVGSLVLPWVWNKRNAALNDAAFDRLALSPHDRVLEVGFGGGYLLGRMSAVITDGLLAGVDISPAMVASCEKRYHSLVGAGQLDLKCASAESLPYLPASFTEVCTVNSIFYWRNVPQALSEFWRVLVDDGTLVMCFTCKESLERRSFTQHGIALYDAGEVQHLMESSGFQEIHTARSADRYREFLCMSGRKSAAMAWAGASSSAV